MKKALTTALLALLLTACQSFTAPNSGLESTPEDGPALTDTTNPPTNNVTTQTQPNMKLAEGATFKLPEGTFAKKDNKFEGEVFVKGYANVKTKDESFCEKDCKKYDYVYLMITESNNDAFTEFLEENSGNSFAGPQGVGLGCVQEGKILYTNESVQTGVKDYELDESLSQSILNSTQDHPIILKLSRMEAAGMGAPECYSHFMTVDQLMI